MLPRCHCVLNVDGNIDSRRALEECIPLSKHIMLSKWENLDYSSLLDPSSHFFSGRSGW